MRKRLLSVLLFVLIIAGVGAAVLAAGGADDPLISASWLYDTLLPRLQGLLRQEKSGPKQLASEYEARLNNIAFSEKTDSGDAGKLTPVSLEADDTVTLEEYSVFLLTSGTAKLRCRGCEVLDLTEGEACADGSWLSPQHRYFVSEGSGAAVYIYAGAEGCAEGGYLRQPDMAFPAEDRYTDTDGHWAEENITRMTELGAVNGIETHRFAPDTTVSRAMFITVLCRLFGSEDIPYEPVFLDVKEGDWYAPYITWAAANGLVLGYGNGYFGPDDMITREQMAAVLARCCSEFGYALPEETDTAGFTDTEKISAWARDAVELSRRAGLLNGRTTGEFDPAGSGTRAEMCAVFCRLYEKTS